MKWTGMDIACRKGSVKILKNRAIRLDQQIEFKKRMKGVKYCLIYKKG